MGHHLTSVTVAGAELYSCVTVREHPVTGDTSVLGWVSPRYRVVQNQEAYAFAQALIDDHGANIVSAGGLYGDRRTFVTLQLPDPIRIGDDPHTPYLVLTNSHDGSTALTTAITPVRIVCPEPDATDRQTKAHADARAALHGLFTTAATQDSIRGTRWAAYNAVTEYADWGPLRGADPTTCAAPPESSPSS